MQRIRIIPQCHPGIGLQVVNINILINFHHVLPLGIDFHQHLLLPHGFDNLADVTARFLEVMQFFAEHPNSGVELIAAGLETGEIGGAGVDLVG